MFSSWNMTWNDWKDVFQTAINQWGDWVDDIQEWWPEFWGKIKKWWGIFTEKLKNMWDIIYSIPDKIVNLIPKKVRDYLGIETASEAAEGKRIKEQSQKSVATLEKTLFLGGKDNKILKESDREIMQKYYGGKTSELTKEELERVKILKAENKAAREELESLKILQKNYQQISLQDQNRLKFYDKMDEYESAELFKRGRRREEAITDTPFPIEKLNEDPAVAQDFVWRNNAKQAIKFSPQDNLMGFKGDGISLKEGKDIYLGIQELQTIMNNINTNIIDLTRVTQNNFKLQPNLDAQVTQPLPENINVREPAFDNIYNFRSRVWQKIIGV